MTRGGARGGRAGLLFCSALHGLPLWFRASGWGWMNGVAASGSELDRSLYAPVHLLMPAG